MKSILTTLILSSLVVLTGCTITPTANTNTTVDNPTNDTVVVTEETEPTETNDNNNANEADNTNETVNKNITADSEVESDTSAGSGQVSEETTGQAGEALAQKDWLTYTNEEYGFSFKYPEGWEIINEEGPFDSIVIDDKKIQSFDFLIDEHRILAVYPEGEFDHDRFINSESTSVQVNGFSTVLSTVGLSQQHIFEDYPVITPGKFRIEAYPRTWSEQVIVNDVITTIDFL